MRKKMRYIVLLLLLIIPSNSIATEWVSFKHPSGIFEINVPKKWGKSTQFKYDPSVFFFQPSSSSEFTVSITPKLNISNELPMRVVTMMFPEETPISKPQRNKGDGWDSIRQDFKATKDGNTRVWLGKFYGYKQRAIAITLSDSEENIENFRVVFEQITKSIIFKAGVTSTPAGLDKKDADRIIARVMEGFWGMRLDTTVRFCSPPMTRSVKVS